MGNFGFEYPRFYALLQIAGSADRRPGLRTSPGHDFVHVCWNRRNFRIGRALHGEPIWNSITLLGRFHQPVVAFIALIAILVSTLNVNIGANVVSPSNDFSNLYPRLISYRTGGMITGFLGLAMQPWKLMATADSYIFGWLEGYAGLMGPIAGIMICDYFLIRRTKLSLYSLYHAEGIYHYSKGHQSSRDCCAGS